MHKNTMGKGEYLYMYLLIAFIFSMWNNCILFINIYGLTYWQSKGIYIGYHILALIIGIKITMPERRNLSTIIGYWLLVTEVLLITIYFQYMKTLVFTVTIVTVTFLLIYLAIFTRKYKKLNRKLKSKRRLGIIKILVVCNMVIPIWMFLQTTLDIYLIRPHTEIADEASVEEYSLYSHIEEVSKIRQDIWATLSIQERLDLLQLIANIEREYLGVVHELNVVSESLDPGQFGYYSNSSHLIVISAEVLANGTSEECVDTLCHEAYHAYQYSQLEVYNKLSENEQNLKMFDEIKAYKEEFEGAYIDGDVDFESYYTQACEEQSRNYAYNSVQEYFTHIAELNDNREL